MSEPVRRHKEQLQDATHSGAAGTTNKTPPQWQLPFTVILRSFRRSAATLTGSFRPRQCRHHAARPALESVRRLWPVRAQLRRRPLILKAETHLRHPSHRRVSMSIFGKIRDAIFGKAKAAQPQTQQPQNPAMPQMTPAQAAPAQPVDVDVDAILADLAARRGEKLNYQSSIVDLMKLLDLDPSLANRKELATELGYTGAQDGSAETNIWLHKQVMKELAANGGKVSNELRG